MIKNIIKVNKYYRELKILTLGFDKFHVDDNPPDNLRQIVQVFHK